MRPCGRNPERVIRRSSLAKNARRPNRDATIAQLALLALDGSDDELALHEALLAACALTSADGAELVEIGDDGERLVLQSVGTFAPEQESHRRTLSVPVRVAETERVLALRLQRRDHFTPDHREAVAAVAEVVASMLRRSASDSELPDLGYTFRDLVERLPIVSYVDALDETFSSIYASPQIESLTGYSPDEWRDDRELYAKTLHPEDRELALAEHRRLRDQGGRLDLQYRLISRSGAVVWVHDRAMVVDGEPGRAPRLEGALLDITEQKRLENELRQAQKMEAIGRLAGGIAHDFNNLVTAIIGYADLLDAQVRHEPSLRVYVDEIARAGLRARDLTRQLLAFSRKQVLRPKVVAVNSVVDNIERMLRRLLGSDVELLVRTEPDAGAVVVDPGQLEQVIVNLAVNARDAMPAGGTLTIATAGVELDEHAARRHDATVPAGSYMSLSVSDTGIGIDQETKRHIFEPFFTTKDAEGGTGLGLSTVYGIVKQSGGFIWVYSEPGAGTTFRIYFPRAEGPGEALAVRRERIARLPRGHETVLLVDDEETIRNLIAHELERLGYAVDVATTYEEALAVLTDRSREFDLLLADVVLPGGRGERLAYAVRDVRPLLRVLMMSGNLSLLGSDSDLETIEKPFSMRQLAVRVRAVLDLG